MRRNEIWATVEGWELGAHCLYCGDVPKVGTLLNEGEVKLVMPHPNNPNQFVAILRRVDHFVDQGHPIQPDEPNGGRLAHA